MYSIVIFVEKNETEVVPSDWLSIDKKVAFWPPYNNATKCKKAVEKNETPDEEWHEYFIECVAEYGELLAEVRILNITNRIPKKGGTLFRM